jgi:hypothetical protein
MGGGLRPFVSEHSLDCLHIGSGTDGQARRRMASVVGAKASMTLDVYADLFDEDFDGVADRLDAAIRSTADQLRTSSS